MSARIWAPHVPRLGPRALGRVGRSPYGATTGSHVRKGNRMLTAATASLALARLRAHLAREEGQTAAEWLGIIVVVAVIVGVMATSDIGESLRGAVTNMITQILGGGKAPSGFEA